MTSDSSLKYLAAILMLCKCAGAKNNWDPRVTSECYDTSIAFSVERSERDIRWEIGGTPLTESLAFIRGYTMYNTTQHKVLVVPVFSIGYRYEDIKLGHFYGSFGVTFRDTKAWNVSKTITERCMFKTQELIVCDPTGVVSVVASTIMVSPWMNPNKTSLLDTNCRPVETDNNRVLFVFTVNTCGTKSRIGANYVSYENEIILFRDVLSSGQAFITRDSDFRLVIRCTYRATGVATLSVDTVPSGGLQAAGKGSVAQKRQDLTRKRSRFKPISNDLLNTLRAEAGSPQTQQLHPVPLSPTHDTPGRNLLRRIPMKWAHILPMDKAGGKSLRPPSQDRDRLVRLTGGGGIRSRVPRGPSLTQGRDVWSRRSLHSSLWQRLERRCWYCFRSRGPLQYISTKQGPTGNGG